MSHLPDWTRFTDDPNDSATKRLVGNSLLGVRQIHTDMEMFDFVLNESAGKRVLEIGVAAHSTRYARDPTWRHPRLCRIASHCVGVDIVRPLVNELREQGFDVHCIDATSDSDLGERFDVVFAGDVIEHVDNPVALLRFAKRHLAPGGRVFASTPNPFSRKFHRRFLNHGVAMINLDHVAWYTPTMALEIGRRAGIDLSAYHLTRPIPKWKRPLKRLTWRVLPPEYSFAEFLYEFRLPDRA